MTDNQILNSIPWHCFHCDFITSDPAEAEAHFGERDDAEEFKPICRWWDRMKDDAERLQTLQDTIREHRQEQDENYTLRKQIEGLEYQVDTNRSHVWRGYKPFRECTSINDIFCLYDSMEGRALASEEQLKTSGGLWFIRAQTDTPDGYPQYVWQIKIGFASVQWTTDLREAVALRSRENAEQIRDLLQLPQTPVEEHGWK